MNFEPLLKVGDKIARKGDQNQTIGVITAVHDDPYNPWYEVKYRHGPGQLHARDAVKMQHAVDRAKNNRFSLSLQSFDYSPGDLVKNHSGGVVKIVSVKSDAYGLKYYVEAQYGDHARAWFRPNEIAGRA